MSSKAYVLRQIKEILQDKKDFSEEEADKFIEDHKDNKVYELLVIKKELRTSVPEEEEEHVDVSTISSFRSS